MNQPKEEMNSTNHTNPSVVKQAPLWSLAMLIIIVFLIQMGALAVMRKTAPEGNLLKLAVILQQLVSILLPVCLLLVIMRLPLRGSLGLHPARWWKTLVAVVVGFVLIYMINMSLPQIIKPTQQFTSRTGSIVLYRNAPEFILTFLTISIVAPLADELFFRGILLQGLLIRYGPIIAILGTGIITALFHKLEPFKLVHSFLMGAIFASSVVWTGSVYTGFILHCLHNSLALIPQG